MTPNYDITRYVKLQMARKEIRWLNYDAEGEFVSALDAVCFAMDNVRETIALANKLKQYKQNK